jgi:hypothetical protein
MEPRHDHSRTDSTQPFRTTRTAQATARSLTIHDTGRTVTLRPLADVLSAATLATLAAVRKAARRG